MKTTPNLSNEFHPIPKTFKAKKGVASGSKTALWENERDKLKKKFAQWGITGCELKYNGCWKDNALSFAHVDKRRNLKADELSKVVLACVPCHTKVEDQSSEEMRKELEKIIQSREWK